MNLEDLTSCAKVSRCQYNDTFISVFQEKNWGIMGTSYNYAFLRLNLNTLQFAARMKSEVNRVEACQSEDGLIPRLLIS